jgi:ATP-dependent protease ClpP protease subunit
MTKNIFIFDTLDKDALESVIDPLLNFDDYDCVNVFLKSHGGELNIAITIANAIINCPKAVLYVLGTCQSAAAYIVASVFCADKSKVICYSNDILGFHIPAYGLDNTRDVKDAEFFALMSRCEQALIDSQAPVMKRIFDEKQYETYLSGKEVFITFRDLV